MYIVESIPCDSITFMDDDTEVTYADCFEVSLLRYLHYILGDRVNRLNGIMNLETMSKFLDNTPECQELVEYFTRHNIIKRNRSYYETIFGNQERSEWCQFLNKRSFFKYKKDGKYKLCACIENINSFFQVFLPKYHITNMDYPVTTFNESAGCTLRTDKIIIHKYNGYTYEWIITQYFDKNNKRITGYSEFI